jgi:hypothetical protein
MSKLVSISINVNLLDKSKLYKGKKGTYLNISGFLKEDADQYGNFGFVTQDGVKTPESNAPILGNFKVKETEGLNTPVSKPALVLPIQGQPSAELVNDDLPF